jgi:two-component system OmpR family response regulator
VDLKEMLLALHDVLKRAELFSGHAIKREALSVRQRMGEVLSRTELSEHLYPQDSERDSNTSEVFVGRLRKKLPPGSIETVRGLGYRLLPVEGAA